MTDTRPSLTVRAAELGVALFTAALGAVVMIGSRQEGLGWTDSGPEPGTFPFYVGLILCAASLGTVVQTVRRWPTLSGAFAERAALQRVMAVFVPLCLYGVGVWALGMVVASALLIGWFMLRARHDDGRPAHARWRIALVAVLVPAAAWAIFDRGFQVPLHTGPFAGLGERIAMAAGH